jgi:hypothetical protein
MLSFAKTAVHPFLPTRYDPVKQPGYSVFMPHQIRLLPGQTVVVDFLLSVQLPEGYCGELRIYNTGRKLHLHAAPLGET